MTKHVRRGFAKRDKPAIDLGTDELRARRLKALGAQRPGWPQPDLSSSESALGILLWQGFLHGTYDQARKMHNAGVQFASWWVLVHPKTFTQGTLGRFVAGSSTEVDAGVAENHLRASSAFLSKDRAILDAVINAAVYQRINLRQMEKLRTGLCRLIEYWRAVQRQERAA